MPLQQMTAEEWAEECDHNNHGNYPDYYVAYKDSVIDAVQYDHPDAPDLEAMLDEIEAAFLAYGDDSIHICQDDGESVPAILRPYLELGDDDQGDTLACDACDEVRLDREVQRVYDSGVKELIAVARRACTLGALPAYLRRDLGAALDKAEALFAPQG